MPESQSETFKIGELIKRSGFNRQQLQNFIVMGLIREAGLTPSGQRLFGAEALKRLAMIRGLLAKDYTLGEIPRTFKRFLKMLLIGATLLGALSVGGAEPALAASGAAKELSAEDQAGIAGVFKELAAAVTRGNAGQVAPLMAPAVPRERVHRVVEHLEADLASRSYEEFNCAFDPVRSVELLANNRVEVRVIITHKYYDKSQPGALKTDDVGQEFRFELVKADGRWRIAAEDYFDSLAAAQGDIFSRLFLWVAVGLVIISFWGWMFLDACFRSWPGRRGRWIAALAGAVLAGCVALYACRRFHADWLMVAAAAAPALAALAYFLGVWMRQEPED